MRSERPPTEAASLSSFISMGSSTRPSGGSLFLFAHALKLRAVSFLLHEVAALFAPFGPYLLTRHLRLELGAFADRALAGVVAYGLVDCHGVLLTRLYLLGDAGLAGGVAGVLVRVL